MADTKGDENNKAMEEVEEENVAGDNGGGSRDSSESESDEESDYSDSDSDDSDSDEEDEEDEEDQGPSLYSRLATRFGPTLAWLHSKSGSIGWILASTFLVVGMPLVFETEREVMVMEQIAEEQKRAAAGKPSINGAGPAAMLPKV